MKLRPLESLVADIYKTIGIPSDQLLTSEEHRAKLFDSFKSQLTRDHVAQHLMYMRKSGRLPKIRVKKERTRPVLVLKKEEQWNEMDNPPQDDAVVVVDLGEGRSVRRYRLAYYYRPDPRSKEIGNKVPYWKWYEQDIGFNHGEGMRWKHV